MAEQLVYRSNSDQNLYSWILKYITELHENDSKRCVGCITISNVTNSSLFPQNHEKDDMFVLNIPYASVNISVQVIFDGLCENSTPDFIMPDDFCPSFFDIKSLVNWDGESPDSLSLVIRDITKLYFNNQLDQVRLTNYTLYEQITDAINSEEFGCIEVFKEPINIYSSAEENTRILIQLLVDFQEIPDIHYKDAPPVDPSFLYPVLLLQVTGSLEKIVPSVFMSKRMEFVLGGQNSFSLPQYNPAAMTIIEYSQAVVRNLQKMIHILVEGHLKRREYIAAMLCQLESNVLEYDSENFNKISLLFCHQDFFFTVHVLLGRFFPHDQPKITVQSVYHTTKHGVPYNQRYTTYPYSPRWSGQEMVRRMKQFLLENADQFKTSSLKNGII